MVDGSGGFDERFHMYGEDNEWCLRIRRAGWRLLFEPAAIVIHHGARSSRQRWTDEERMRVQLGALFRFQGYALSRRRRIANLLARSFVLGLASVWRRLRRRPAADLSLPLSLYLEELGNVFRNREPAPPSDERPTREPGTAS